MCPCVPSDRLGNPSEFLKNCALHRAPGGARIGAPQSPFPAFQASETLIRVVGCGRMYPLGLAIVPNHATDAGTRVPHERFGCG